VGTLGALTVTGNVAGGNLTTAGQVSATGNVSGGNLNVTGNIVDTGALSIITAASGNVSLAPNGTNVLVVTTTGANVTGNLSISTGTVTLGNIVNANANGVGNIGSSSGYFNTIFATATSAQYADLAELYLADKNYNPGTVLEFGGMQEVTLCNTPNTHKVAGVVSTNPAYVMNSGLAGDYVCKLALVGRVPCLVRGPVEAGDLLVSDTNGWARVNNDATAGRIIGKSLQSSFNDGEIEIVVGKH
jgi:hypothetical protein